MSKYVQASEGYASLSRKQQIVFLLLFVVGIIGGVTLALMLTPSAPQTPAVSTTLTPTELRTQKIAQACDTQIDAGYTRCNLHSADIMVDLPRCEGTYPDAWHGCWTFDTTNRNALIVRHN